MDWNIEGGYGFKISCKIGDDEPVKANSLEEALTRLSSDKILWAF